MFLTFDELFIEFLFDFGELFLAFEQSTNMVDKMVFGDFEVVMFGSERVVDAG